MSLFWTLALLSQSPVFAAVGCPALPEKLLAIATASRARVGLTVTHLESGARVSLRGGEAFPTQSTYKLPIALAALKLADRNRWPYTRPVRLLASDVVSGPFASPTRARYWKGQRDFALAGLVTDAIAHSDNTASDALLRLAGGPKGVNAYLAGLGLGAIRVATPVGRFAPHRNLTTPDAMAALLGKLHAGAGLSPAARTLVLDAMAHCTTGPGRLKGLLPVGTPVAHKTGTSGTFRGVTTATNDVGIVTLPDGKHLAMAIYVANAPGEVQAERTIARLAQAAWSCFTTPSSGVPGGHQNRN